MEKVKCPYCENDTEFDDCEMNENEETYEIECEHCEKLFQVDLSFIRHYRVRAADCLNTDEHNFQKIRGYPEIHFKGKYHCLVCGAKKTVEEEVATKEEWDQFFKR